MACGNNDPWDWYGWYVISGERSGHFIDATFGHSWSDFDNPVNPAGDGADNDLHTEPFGNFIMGYKLSLSSRTKHNRQHRFTIEIPAYCNHRYR